jgi:hypothetical protein
MFRSISKYLSVAGMVFAIAGCKLALMVPSGGDVKSESGSRDCAGGTICEYDISDYTFKETFTAVARPGYRFTRWNEGMNFLCGDSVNSACEPDNTGLAQPGWGRLLEVFEAILPSGNFLYIMPIFDFVGIDTDGDDVADHLDEDDDNDGFFDGDDACPLNPDPDCDINSIIVNGRTWAQPTQFVTEGGLSWNAVNAACPEGVCEGTLNGYNVTGWTWATQTDMAELFYHYHEDNEFLDSGRNYWSMKNSPWAPKFFDDGWKPTYLCFTPSCTFDPTTYYQETLTGYLYQPDPIDRYGSCCGGYATISNYISNNSPNEDNFYYVGRGIAVDSMNLNWGIWLYKD